MKDFKQYLQYKVGNKVKINSATKDRIKVDIEGIEINIVGFEAVRLYLMYIKYQCSYKQPKVKPKQSLTKFLSTVLGKGKYYIDGRKDGYRIKPTYQTTPQQKELILRKLKNIPQVKSISKEKVSISWNKEKIDEIIIRTTERPSTILC